MFAKKFLQKDKWYQFSYSIGSRDFVAFAQFKGYKETGRIVFIEVLSETNQEPFFINIEMIGDIHSYTPDDRPHDPDLF